MEYATLLNMDRQGRIVIPIQVRKALKLEEGDLLALEANEKNILLRKQTAYIPSGCRSKGVFRHSSCQCSQSHSALQ